MKRETFSWCHPALELKEFPDKGSGLITNTLLSADTIVIVFGGYVSSIKDETELDKAILDNGHQISPNFVLGVRSEADLEYASLVNHSCDPNCGFGGQIFLRTMREVKAGEEITFDYAMAVGEEPSGIPYKMECHCGSPICRGVITDHDWRQPELQKKYRGYFQYYLERQLENQ